MSSRRRPTWLIAVLACLLLVPTGAATAGSSKRAPDKASRVTASKPSRPRLTPVRPDALTRRLHAGRISEARYALERARTLFDLPSVRARYGEVGRPKSGLATFLLRDLSLRKSALSGENRREAERMFLRPDTRGGDELTGYIVDYTVPSKHVCSSDPAVKLCFHWVETTRDKATDAEVQAAQDVFTQVWNAEIGTFGFQPPKGDSTSAKPGPNEYTDIYLANLGPNYYGYCTSDDPNVDRIFSGRYDHGDVSSYCVVDNNFVEFEANTPLDNLRVTAAHEFLHAIQFAYDYLEDFWMLEGTAAAIEDFVYDDVNDNLQYLRDSPMVNPRQPLDFSDSYSIYGTWSFWRFLSEKFSSTGTADPLVIREILERAESSKASGIIIEDSLYSLQAVKQTLAARGTDLTTVFSAFGLANFQAAGHYEEGVEYDAYLQDSGARGIRKARVSPASPVKKGESKLDHLATLWKLYAPGEGVAADAQLELKLNLPDTKRGSAASVRIFRIDGTQEIQTFALSPDGAGTLTVPFGGATVEKVLLVLTNASTRTDCYSRRALYTSSCYGKPRDDRQPYVFTARLL